MRPCLFSSSRNHIFKSSIVITFKFKTNGVLLSNTILFNQFHQNQAYCRCSGAMLDFKQNMIQGKVENKHFTLKIRKQFCYCLFSKDLKFKLEYMMENATPYNKWRNRNVSIKLNLQNRPCVETASKQICVMDILNKISNHTAKLAFSLFHLSLRNLIDWRSSSLIALVLMQIHANLVKMFVLLKIIIIYFSATLSCTQAMHQNLIKTGLINEQFRKPGQELKQIFLCSCGKQYLSFPAIYLHFRVKHHIKLSTKQTESRKSETIEKGVKKISYYAGSSFNSGSVQHQQSPSSENSSTCNKQLRGSQNIQQIEKCVQKYISLQNNSSFSLYQQLIEFLKQKDKSRKQLDEPIKISNVPYFLNDFALEKLSKDQIQTQLESRSWKESCLQLIKFCSWLRKEKHTQLLVQYIGV